MKVRLATPADARLLWGILEPVIRAGETYALDRDMTEAAATAYWLGDDRETYVIEDNGRLLGTYYLRTNQPGGGNHVANCGYMVASDSNRRGVGRMMGEHSIARARELGYRAIQFNFVVSTNERAVRLWQSLGFQIAGRLPGAFVHPTLGEVDALVMYQRL